MQILVYLSNLGMGGGGVVTPKEIAISGGIFGFKAQINRTETEQEKQARREASGIIEKIKKAKPADLKEIKQKANKAVESLRAIQVDLALQLYKQHLAQQSKLQQVKNLSLENAELKRQQVEEIKLLMQIAQIKQEQINQQIEELDVVFITFMLAAQAY
jgi:hypothetical protein